MTQFGLQPMLLTPNVNGKGKIFVEYSKIFTHFCYSSLPDNRRNKVSCSSIISKFTEIYPLPCTHIEFAMSDGDADFSPDERGFGVCRHIIITLKSVLIIRLSFPDEVVEDGVEVVAHIGVGILIDTECCTGMTDKEMEQAAFREFR